MLARWDASTDLAPTSVGFLVHGLLDAVVDGHYNAIQSLEDAIEELEDGAAGASCPRPGTCSQATHSEFPVGPQRCA
ncbi:MAG: magnesium and cobalt transporter CorA [Modestobacter sp.]|nr:magnesium and cobalt transporter CorA [Modestobacter sp.]